jgi:peptidoglycan/LPS O-acetylase OafA/YrhL
MRKRLSGLDGIRGLAALYVVFNHIFERTFPGDPADHSPWWASWFIYGRFAVVVFIVLAGFSLALSPARHGWRLDSVYRFAGRRARRILPAYLAALAFSLAVAWLVVPQPGEGVPTGKSVAVNALLVQNLVRAPSPNKSFWSMAIEAQLYVVFPLLLLLVRRFGGLVMVAAVTILVATVGILGPHVARLHTLVIQSPPDLAALFAIGIMAAGIVGATKARGGWHWLARTCRSVARATCDLFAGARGGRSLHAIFCGWISHWDRPSRACSSAWPPVVLARSSACSTRGRSAASASRPTASTSSMSRSSSSCTSGSCARTSIMDLRRSS